MILNEVGCTRMRGTVVFRVCSTRVILDFGYLQDGDVRGCEEMGWGRLIGEEWGCEGLDCKADRIKS